MKKFVYILALIMSLALCASGCDGNQNESVIRIHIRANSNSEEDQQIKLKVRDEILLFITPLISTCENSEDVKDVLSGSLNDIQKISNKILNNSGFKYESQVIINNEYFPTRAYNDNVFKADYYDALIVNLGSGKGDNWWCVAYPPLCFVSDGNDSGNVEYKSKLVELINKYFGR